VCGVDGWFDVKVKIVRRHISEVRQTRLPQTDGKTDRRTTLKTWGCTHVPLVVGHRYRSTQLDAIALAAVYGTALSIRMSDPSSSFSYRSLFHFSFSYQNWTW